MPKRSEVPRYATYLSRLRIRNFRCYEDSGDVQLRPLTILIGANNAGKSTLIDALLLAKQSLILEKLDTGLVTAGEEADLGGFFDILRGGYKSKNRRFSIVLELTKIQLKKGTGGKIPLNGRSTRRVWFEAIVSFDDRSNKASTTSCRLGENANQIAKIAVNREKARIIEPSIVGLNKVEVELRGLLPVALSVQTKRNDPSAKKIYALSDSIMRNYFWWFRFFKRMQQIRPLRGPIPRYSILGRTPAVGLGAEGEALIRTLRNRRRVDQRADTLLEAMNGWLSDRLQVVRKIRLSPLDKETGVVASLVGDERVGFEGINLANMGEGLSQMLPVFAKVLGSDYDSCVVVQQPEIHLHPALQADLADLFIENLLTGNNSS